MKNILIAILLINPTLSLADDIQNKKNDIVEMASEIITTTKGIDNLSVLNAVARDLEIIINKLGGVASPGQACFSFLMNKGYGPEYSKSQCAGLKTSTSFYCFRGLVNRGYSPEYSKSQCIDMENPSTFECFKLLVDKGYGPDYSKVTCKSVNTSGEVSCVIDLVSKGYGPDYSVKQCEGF